jgi:hypothetical protein
VTDEKRRLARLGRLERIRAVTRHEAARRSAEAESVFARMDALARRSQQLAQDYAARGDALQASDLAQLRRFQAELVRLGHATARQAGQAQVIADRTRQDLARAERQREQVADRLENSRRTLRALREKAANPASDSAPRKSGTLLD